VVDFESKLQRLSKRGTPVGAEEMIERIEAELAGDPLVVVTKQREGTLMTNTDQPVSTKGPRPARGLAWALVAFVAILTVGGLYFAFSGDDGEVIGQPTARTFLSPWGSATLAEGVELSLMVPGDWEINDGFVVKDDDSTGTHMRVGAGIIGNLFADRCQWRTTSLDPPLGPSVGDLATAFTTIWGSDATPPVDVAVDGFEGKYMVLTVPADVDFADCDSEQFVGWTETGVSDSSGPSRIYQGPGQILEHWILDVDGVRLVIEASHFPEVSSEGLAELQGIIDSMGIEMEAAS
jgi:hypothetical protein